MGVRVTYPKLFIGLCGAILADPPFEECVWEGELNGSLLLKMGGEGR